VRVYPGCDCTVCRMSRSDYQDEAVVCQLKQELHEKDLRLTDIQLEALSSAHQLEQLCETISRMKVCLFRFLLSLLSRPVVPSWHRNISLCS